MSLRSEYSSHLKISCQMTLRSEHSRVIEPENPLSDYCCIILLFKNVIAYRAAGEIFEDLRSFLVKTIAKTIIIF